MADILKFACAATDESNLEFATLLEAITYWRNNLVDVSTGTPRQRDDVIFLQDGPYTIAATQAITLAGAAVDSQGYSFIVTNPENHNWSGTNIYNYLVTINFNNYKCADIILNRLCNVLVSGLPTSAANTYHAADNDNAVRVYNCVFYYNASFNLVNSGASIRVYIYNNIVVSLTSIIGIYSSTLPIVMENNIFVASGSSYMVIAGNSSYILANGSRVVNNLFCKGTPSVSQAAAIYATSGWTNLAAIKDDIPKNAYSFEQSTDGTFTVDPSRQKLNLRELFPWIVPSNAADNATVMSSIPAHIRDNIHGLVRVLTPRSSVMETVIPPEADRTNPLRYFLNGGDSHWGEQYGPSSYIPQRYTEVRDLQAEDIGDLKVKLTWGLPPAGLPPGHGFTKWAIYKVFSPIPPTTLQAWVDRPHLRVGDVPINTFTFVDTGTPYTNSAGQEMMYRVIAEV